MTMAESNSDFPEDILRECVRQMYSSIVRSVESKGYVLDSLFAEGTITKDEKQQIERLPERRSAALVDLLYTCQRPKTIAKFLDILSNNEMTACKWITDEVYKVAHDKVASASTSSLGVPRNSVPMMSTSEKKYRTILSNVYMKCIQKL